MWLAAVHWSFNSSHLFWHIGGVFCLQTSIKSSNCFSMFLDVLSPVLFWFSLCNGDKSAFSSNGNHWGWGITFLFFIQKAWQSNLPKSICIRINVAILQVAHKVLLKLQLTLGFSGTVFSLVGDLGGIPGGSGDTPYIMMSPGHDAIISRKLVLCTPKLTSWHSGMHSTHMQRAI